MTGKLVIEPSIADVMRGALNGGHPLGLLTLASVMIRMTVPDPFPKWRSRQREPIDMDRVIASFSRAKSWETTALLAVLAELMLSETDRQDHCRRKVAARNDRLPEWIPGLAHIQVYRAVRATHVVGDEDELLIGAQLGGGYELTCVVHLNHNMLSEVDDAYFLPQSIDNVLSVAIERNTDPDVSFVDMNIADIAKFPAERAAVRERLARLEKDELAARLLAIGHKSARRMSADAKALDHGALLYDDRGLPS